MNYYQRIRDLREDHDLTQNDIVAILKMHKTTYTNYEQERREPPSEFIIRLLPKNQSAADKIKFSALS